MIQVDDGIGNRIRDERQFNIIFLPVPFPTTIFLCLFGVRIGWAGLAEKSREVLLRGNHTTLRSLVFTIIEFVGASHYFDKYGMAGIG